MNWTDQLQKCVIFYCFEGKEERTELGMTFLEKIMDSKVC
jgi:hypothetical protein